jgi:hypothetical protein
MTDPTVAASALGNITPWAWALYIIAGALAAGLLGWATWTIAAAALGSARIARRKWRRRDLPRLARAIGTVERRTQAMSAAELDAVHGPKLGELVSQDRIITEQWRAAFGEMTDALTPRMVAPSRADLAAIDAVQVNGRRRGNLGDLDPDPGLGDWR